MSSLKSLNNSMKHIGHKNVGFKIEIMKWSDKMDLIALGNDKGEVIIHRLKWQKVWQHSPPEEGLKVRGIAWRPHEKVIAIAYSNGTVQLLNLENQNEIHSFSIKSDIDCINWTQNAKENTSDSSNLDIVTSHSSYLPMLPSLSALSSNAKSIDYNTLKLYSKNIINLLVIGSSNGFVHLSVFGMLACGEINVYKKLNIQSGKIQDAKLSSNFKQLFVIIEGINSLELFILENNILQKYSPSLLNLAIKHAHILNTMAYISDTIECITEAWETVLLEMDNKLTKYANSQSQGSISADFLELLLFGYTSEALEHFLLKELTEKGLKKLGNSIELSYSTIQKLVVKPLHTAIIIIFYHLNSLMGMVKNEYYYKALIGDISNEAITNCGAFLVKAYELQQVIDTSTRDYKIFFRWLYVVIVRLMEETVPEDNPNLTQQEVKYLAEFLNNFDLIAFEDEASLLGDTEKKFNLERVGQYLEDKNLAFPSKWDATNQWSTLLEQNECLKSCPLIYPHHQNLSLIQQHNLLRNSVQQIFEKPKNVVGEDFKLKGIVWNKYENTKWDKISVTHINLEKENVALFALLETEKCLLIVECGENVKPKILKMQFDEKSFSENKFSNFGQLTFKHVQFFNEETLTILLNNHSGSKNETYFLQFAIRTAREALTYEQPNHMVDVRTTCKTVNACNMIDESSLKLLEGIDGSFIAVSGPRNVASVLSESRKTIRIYLMDEDDDEDELEILSPHNSSFDNSKESNNSVEM